ncbi:MAG: FKBP-type peptidyl-prolyl cis-trans isomerase [Bacteroidia bacterium]|nr:FKBP-type peptidyl-prolyl cis-trans isomerase [Bacteroidia bacterium]
MIKRNIQTILLLFTTILMLSLGSCDPGKEYEKEENAKIQAYLSSNPTLNFELKTSGLFYLEVQTGSGPLPVTSDTAYIMYTGKFLDGTVFATNIGTIDTIIRPVESGWLIPGLSEGITYLREGGKSVLLVPSKLAYGPNGYYVYDSSYGYYPVIPGYTPLLFDVELVRIKAGPGK